MKFEPHNCPTCGSPAKGTLETVSGVALLTEPDEDGHVDYFGETKMCWDEQRTVVDEDGRVTLICDEGHDWQAENAE